VRQRGLGEDGMTDPLEYKFRESQKPCLTEGDNWFEYISLRAARLNCYGEAFAEIRERLGGIDPATDQEKRKRLQVQIDAPHSTRMDWIRRRRHSCLTTPIRCRTLGS
jgi:hypothetical protein